MDQETAAYFALASQFSISGVPVDLVSPTVFVAETSNDRVSMQKQKQKKIFFLCKI